MKLAICICTYQRVQLLQCLLEDIPKQEILPEKVILVDGDPDSNDIITMLESRKFPFSIIYTPSNHGNLAYQRYLGWRVAQAQDMDFLLYLDDDLRIYHSDTIEKIISPMLREQDVVGVTAGTETGEGTEQKFAEHPVLLDREQTAPQPWLARWFGSSRNTSPGGLTPVGGRIFPIINTEGYGKVEWLSGRVMAYRMLVLDEAVFSNDLFALTHIHCGMGEDTFLSQRVGRKGKMLLAFHAVFLHPHDALPNSYPIQAKKLGYAIAYSRRLLNDYYRGTPPPYLSDRMVLIKSYLGHILLSWFRIVSRPAPYRYRLAYAWGYTLGALRGLIQSPTAKKLTPQIDWRADAEMALLGQKRI